MKRLFLILLLIFSAVQFYGVFNRPFGYELNYFSSLRESPERGRMSQILMKTERDIGAMLSFEQQETMRYLLNY